MTILEKVKLARRIKTDAYDEEINSLISAAVFDMKRAGVTNTENALAEHAEIMYCKAYFGNYSDSERCRQCYELIRDGLALMGDDVDAGNDSETAEEDSLH